MKLSERMKKIGWHIIRTLSGWDITTTTAAVFHCPHNGVAGLDTDTRTELLNRLSLEEALATRNKADIIRLNAVVNITDLERRALRTIYLS